NDFENLKVGAHTLYIEGCFTYRTFGKDRHTAFCYFMRPLVLSETIPKVAGGNTTDPLVRPPAGSVVEETWPTCVNPNTSYAN
ncbi:MAG TPA: hypothetical protein VHW69_17295, partial [Rhizomicrobium sp.]|nr:hypothetical protein [Rhizomicrobium sp.]